MYRNKVYILQISREDKVKKESGKGIKIFIEVRR